MIKLKNSERDAVVHAVLAEAFELRFDALAKALEQHAKEELLSVHPYYFKLRSDKAAAPYLKGIDVLKFGIDDSYAVRPLVYDKAHRMPIRPWDDGEHVKTLRPLNTLWSPDSREFSVKSEELAQQYRDLWADLTGARLKLSAALHSFVWREKFVESFPQFAKYLPQPTRPAKLPAVIVSDVLADLAACGVPAKS